MKTGMAHLPLHYGKAPRWLFERMRALAREITIAVVLDFGPEEMLKKLADPFWFQAFGCVLGFDWHSSGVTTTVCGALKGGLKDIQKELGLFVAGGKGKVSRKTPAEIESCSALLDANPGKLVYASRMAAKVDSAAIQDGYQLYHHVFFFTSQGKWAVVQQGMEGESRLARRYHWLSDELKDFVCEPHLAICSEGRRKEALNLVAAESDEVRATTTNLSHQKPEKLVKEIKRMQSLYLPRRHYLLVEDIHPGRLEKIFLKTYQRQPEDFEHLLALEGVGPKSLRALSLISELIYGVAPSWQDPARFSFAHGGKDGHPYPVDRQSYDKSIELLKKATLKAKLGRQDRLKAIQRLAMFVSS